MNDIARLKLREIVAQYGFAIGDDPRLCESLLRDFCGEQHLEINILVGAVKQRVVADLLGSSGSVPTKLLFNQLAKRLYVNLGFAPDIAIWGVESWAFALGLISAQELSTGTPHIKALQSAAAGQVQQGYQSTTSAVPSASSTSSEDVLRQALKVALADGVIADAERAMLSDLANQPGIPYSVSGQIFSDMEGQPPSGTTAVAPVPSTPAAETQAATCPKCGAPLRPNARFCQECGNRFTGIVTSQPSTAGSLPTAGKSLRNSDSRGSDASPLLTVAQTGSSDYATIGEAILAAGPGTQILVQPGLYRESLDIDKALEIIGNGRLADIIIESPDGSTPCITSSATGSKLKGLTLRGPLPKNKLTSTFSVLDVAWGQLAVEDCDIHTGVRAVLIRNKAHLSMTNCIIRDFTEHGILALAQAQGIVQGCEIYNTPRRRTPGRRPSGRTKLSSGVVTSDTSNLSVLGCKIHDCTEHGIFASVDAQGIIEDCEIYNTPTGVKIDQTSYLTIRGSKIHDCTERGIVALGKAQSITQACEIYNTPEGVRIAETSKLSVLGCKIHDCTGIGIYALSKAQGIIDDCEIHNTPTGIRIQSTSNLNVRGCKIHDCVERRHKLNLYPPEGFGTRIFIEIGIVAFGKATGIIQDCEIYNTPSGVTMTNTSDLSFLDSKIHNCSKYALEILELSHATVENCEIYSNGESGVQIAGTDHLTLLGCRIDENGGVAPTVRDAYDFKVS